MGRYVVLGAGAVGGAIGGRLHQHGHEVVLIARGAHREAMAADGLRLRDPDAEVVLRPPIAGGPDEVDWRAGDVAIVAVKTQDGAAALDALAAAAGPGVPVLCAQNGVENERTALRRFRQVYGMSLILPADHLEPGRVDVYTAPITGALDVGRYPAGVDDVAEAIVADLAASSFDAQLRDDVMRWKRGKLLHNLRNALEAVAGSREDVGDLHRRAQDEARACFAAAGLAYADAAEDRARRAAMSTPRPIAGHARAGSSSWQSLARGTGSIEADWLNGEIVLLGRLHGIPTPVNERLQQLAGDLARRGGPPGSVGVDELRAGLPAD